jgi:hypothetical protein
LGGERLERGGERRGDGCGVVWCSVMCDECGAWVGWMYGWMYGWMSGCMDVWMDGGCCLLDVGCWMIDFGCRMLGGTANG